MEILSKREDGKRRNGQKFLTHKRLRNAYRSLKTNLKWLFTWYDNIDLGIPNTTGVIDGHFADLKNKLRNYNGLSIERKKKFIDEFRKSSGVSLAGCSPAEPTSVLPDNAKVIELLS